MELAPLGRRGYVDGLWGQVHVRRLGEGPPVVLLHQAPWSAVQFQDAAPLIAAEGFEAILPDMPGYGLSDAPTAPPSIADYARNLAVALEALGVPAATVVGHHTGALIAGALAAEMPQAVAALVFDNAPFYTAQERADRLAMSPEPFTVADDGSHFIKRWRFMREGSDPDLTAPAIHRAVMSYFEAGPHDIGHAAAYAYDFSPAIDAIRAPTLVLASRGDRLFAHGARLKERRPDWSYRELDAGTALVLEQPRAWAEAVLAGAPRG